MLLTQISELVIASHNKGKVREISNLLSHFSCKISSAADYGLDSPEETENNFEGNALLKARYVMEKTGKPALADDSGLSVNALDGQPGIYSARWAENDDFNIAMARIQRELADKHSSDEATKQSAEQGDNENNDFSAAFYCALALVIPGAKKEYVFLGTVKGDLTFPPRGDKGFGYDPIFIAKGMDKTFAEMDPAQKHSISHRADAFHQFINAS